MKTHEKMKNEKKYDCNFCSCAYTTASARSKHIKLKHIFETRGVKCPHCTEVFFLSSSLTSHVSKCHRFLCEFRGCEEYFIEESKLDLHIFMSHVCKLCSSIFLKKKNLKEHVRTHNFLN